MSPARVAAAALALALAGRPLAAQSDSYAVPLAPTPAAGAARGQARLHYAASPFGIAVTVDGRASYDLAITLTGLPAPASLGRYGVIVAWAVSPDLSLWQPLGAVSDGTTTLGPVALNKFLVVISAETTAEVTTHAGPVLLRGYSPSIWLQSFITHPLFRGVN